MKFQKSNAVFVILTVLAALILTYLLIQPKGLFSSIYIEAADTKEHLESTDNFIENGVFSLGDDEPTAIRMPGYAMAYFPLRAILPKAYARQALLLLQMAAYMVGVYCLLLFFLENGISLVIAKISIAFFVFVNYLNPLHFQLLPVSLAISLFLILTYLIHFLKNVEKANKLTLLAVGFTCIWLGFLRPFLLPFLILLPALLWLLIKKIRLKHVIWIYIPMAIVEGFWITRNYVTFQEFIPLQTTFAQTDQNDFYKNTGTKQSLVVLRGFIAGFGGDNVWYFPESHMHWFLTETDVRRVEHVFPKQVFDAGIKEESLIELKKLILNSRLSYELFLEDKIKSTALEFEDQLKANTPFQYYFVSRVKFVAHMIFSNVTQDWPTYSYAESPIYIKLYKVAMLGFYLFCLGFAFLTALLIPLNKDLWFHYTFIGFNLILFPYVIKFNHYQYFAYAFISCFILSILHAPSLFKTYLSKFLFKIESRTI